MKKIFKSIIVILLGLIILAGTFGTVDYIRAKNKKEPIFSHRTSGYSMDEIYVNNNDSNYSGVRYGATEYYGFGYKIVVCYSCNKSVYFMPLGIGSYAWFIGMPVEKLNGTYFNAYSNDMKIYFDGIGGYSLTENEKTTDSGNYTIQDNNLILNPSGGDNWKCSIEKDYKELYCDKHAERFMK